MMKWKPIVPPGQYWARFLGVEDRDDENYGPGLAWRFVILDGPYAGQEVSRITSLEPTKRNACGKLFQGLAGGRVADGAQLDIDSFIGREYGVVIVESSTGQSTRVESVFPQPGMGLPGMGLPNEPSPAPTFVPAGPAREEDPKF
jgi:hypothetical protein